MTVAIGTAIVTSSFPSHERGRAIGLIATILGFGLLSGPALGGIILDLLGWRAVFFVRIPIGIIAAIMAWTLLKDQASARQEGKFDLPGAVTLFLFLSCLLLAVNRGQILGWTSPLVMGMSIATVLFLSLFLIAERRAQHPVLDMRLFRNRLFSAASGSHLLLYMSLTSVSFLTPFYLIQGLGLSASKAGLILITINGIGMLIAPITGRLSDRWGTLFLCSTGLALVSAGTLLLRSLGTDVSIMIVVLYLAVIGLGMGFFTSPNTSAIMGSVPKERLSTASAMVGLLRQMGMSIGLAIAASIFAASRLSHATQLTSQGLPEDAALRLSTIGGFQDTIFVALALALSGLIISALRGRKREISD